MTRRLLIALATGSLVSPVDYGAECDVDLVYDAVVAGGALSTITSASAAFDGGDTGKTFYLASTAGVVTTGTLTFVNSTTCTMSTAAGGAMTGARFIWGIDDTAAWQAALDAALPGQTVDIADTNWRSLCIGQLNVPDSVNLGATDRGPFDPQTNPVANDWGPTFVVGQDATTPFITLNTGSGLGDHIFYSANQVPPTATTPTAFAAFVELAAAGGHVGSPYFANAYVGIAVECGRTYIDTVTVGALFRGVTVDHAEDAVSIHRIRVHPFWRVCEGMAYTPTAGSLDEYALSNAYGLVIYRADALMVGSVFSFGAYCTVYATDSPDTGLSPRAGWALIGQVDADAVAYGVIAHSTADQSILVGQGTFSANASGVGTAGQNAARTAAGGISSPELVVRSWSHRGTWAAGASLNSAGTLVVPATNPG